MGDTFDAAGDLAAAGLVASQLGAGPTQTAGHGGHGGACRNCGTPLAGAYCQACGQSAHVHRSLLHLGEELLHGLLHFDAKGWRTLPLLVGNPGLLTRRYIDGQRTRYVSPLGLFLFMVFLMFFVVSLTGGSTGSVQGDRARGRQELAAQVEEAQRALDKAERRLREREADAARTAATTMAAASAAGDAPDTSDLDEAKTDVTTARAELQAARVALAVFDSTVKQEAAAASAAGVAASSPAAASGASAASAASANSDAAADDLRTPAEKFAEALRKENDVEPGAGSAVGNRARGTYSSNHKLDGIIRHALHNPELAIYKLKNAVSKYSFLLVPISLPFLWLMFFWRPGVTLYDHAVFSLYSLSFMSLFAVVVVLLPLVRAGALVPWLVVAVPPLHMAAQLRGTYGLGAWSTAWRTVALLCVTGTVFLLFLLFALAVSIV